YWTTGHSIKPNTLHYLKIWQNIKRQFTNRHFESLEQISNFFTHTIKNLTVETIKSTCSYAYMSLDSIGSV
ncbi:MAG: hypothetical protein ACK5NK_16170, partial [Niabella sp.]